MRTIGTLVVAAAASVALAATLPAQAKLDLKVVTSSPGGFLVNSTLISGAKEAILVDAQFTRADAHRLVARIFESGRKLTTVYVTHDHPDHYFGLEVIRQAFPSVKVVALPGAVAGIRASWKGKVAQWKPMYGDAITSTPVLPRTLVGNTITLEGEKLQVVGPVQGDDAVNSYLWIPSLRAVVAGDIVYNGVYAWTAETNPASRKAWIATLDKIAALNPAIVVAGHQKTDAGTSPSSLNATKEYLVAFDAALAQSKSAEELVAKVKQQYGDLALDVILNIGAQAAFKPAKQ